MRLSTRIALAVGASVPVLVLATGWLLLRLVAADLHDQQDAHLRERATAVAKDARGLLRASAADRSAAVEQARERRLFTSALDVGVRLIGPEETFTGGPQPDQEVSLPQSAPVPVTLRAGGRSWRVLSTRVTGARPGVRGTLWLFAPDTAGEAQLRLVRRRVVTVALLAAPLSGLLAGAVASRASRPLRRLRDSASGLDPRSSTARLDHAPTRIAEVDDLAHTLQTVLTRYDEQAARTAEALATARSFASAASHELRTPLMSMQTNLEILTEHPELPGPDRDETLGDLRREHARLLGLLVMLRELGRGDLVEADAFGPVDLTDVVEASAGTKCDAIRSHGSPETARPVCVSTAGSPGCARSWTTSSPTRSCTAVRTVGPRGSTSRCARAAATRSSSSTTKVRASRPIVAPRSSNASSAARTARVPASDSPSSPSRSTCTGAASVSLTRRQGRAPGSRSPCRSSTARPARKRRFPSSATG